jgi:replicative DNA helicase
MTAISNELRVLSKDLDLPFAVLAQLNRPVKGQAVKPPALTDLRDSGEIEQDAEAVMFLHRPKYYDQGGDDNVDVIIAKNRDGEDGIATLLFDGQGTRMLDWPASYQAPAPPTPHPDNRIDDDQPF